MEATLARDDANDRARDHAHDDAHDAHGPTPIAALEVRSRTNESIHPPMRCDANDAVRVDDRPIDRPIDGLTARRRSPPLSPL